MHFRVDDIPTNYRHQELDRLHACLRTIDFPERYDALCAAHPHRGREVPVAERMPALKATGRYWYFDKTFKHYSTREKEVVPRYCGLGMDLKIDARVELALMFATADGHLSAPFAKIARDMHRATKPGFSYYPNHPAPRIGSLEELPVILKDVLELYDAVADAIRTETWWHPPLAQVA